MQFASGDISLHGTVFIPSSPGPHPAVVVVHGTGLGLAEDYRTIAEVFSDQGFLTLIYDKRTEGYSTSPMGARSYALLAADVVAAVQSLRRRDDVDEAAVGVWGLSEGGWIAPLAAVEAPQIAFVIAVAGGGIGPARQTAWSVKNALFSRGVTSAGTLIALSDRVYSMLVALELFAEGHFDPVPVLARLQQPLLAIWGAEDALMPPGASSAMMHQVLEEIGHRSHTLRIVPGADHEVRVQSVTGSRGFDPDYIDFMVHWMRSVVAGEVPNSSVDEAPLNETSVPIVIDPALLWQGLTQVWVFATIQLLLGASFGLGVLRKSRSVASLQGKEPYRRLSRVVFGAVLLATWGVYAAVAIVAATAGQSVGLIVAERPLFWLVLQLVAVVAATSTLVLFLLLIRGRFRGLGTNSVRPVLLLGAGLFFIPWAAWWQLFTL